MLNAFTPNHSSRRLLDRRRARVRAHSIVGQRLQNCTDLTALQDSAEKSLRRTTPLLFAAVFVIMGGLSCRDALRAREYLSL
jgi:hypothetical protein